MNQSEQLQPPQPSRAQLPAREVLSEAHLRSPRSSLRRPIILFVLTCFSTFIAGALNWNPVAKLSLGGIEIRRCLLNSWDEGLAYMGAVLLILFFHEMGHYIAARIHGVPASYPFFIPFPISPIGTMGAVIGMKGNFANRKQLFDIGIAGPLAGLVIAVPAIWFGIQRLDLSAAPSGPLELDCPVIVRILLSIARPDLKGVAQLSLTQVNPVFMAGWVGMLITGLNMMPISQLDGGHVIYTLFLKRAHVVARIFIFIVIAYTVLAGVTMWGLMMFLVILMGVDHPPTGNDAQPLGRFRTALGYASLLIPILCFPARGFLFSN